MPMVAGVVGCSGVTISTLRLSPCRRLRAVSRPRLAARRPEPMTVPRYRDELRSPLHDWRVTAAPRSGIAGGIRRRETPFVGRTALLRRFDGVLDRARLTRRVVVRLVGEAGIGKTRLLGEVARRGLLLGLDVRWIDDVSGVPSGTGSDAPRMQDAERFGRPS